MRQESVLAKVTNNLKEVEFPNIHIQEHTHLGNNTFSILCSHPANSKGFTEEEYEKAVTAAFNRKFSLVSGTLLPVDTSDPRKLVRMIIAPNTEVVPYTEEATQKMKVVRANMFVDDEDKIWRVVGDDESGRHLVQVSEDNYNEILSARRSRLVVNASENNTLEFANGDYIFYFSPETYTVKAGFGLHTNYKGDVVFDRESGKTVEICKEQVVEAIDGTSLDEDKRADIKHSELSVDFGSDMASRHLEYMRKLYNGTDYFRKLEELVNKRRSTGVQMFETMKV